jgi:hypothetical protein
MMVVTGERIVACGICEVWQHRKCCGIDGSETVLPLFILDVVIYLCHQGVILAAMVWYIVLMLF